ncbi:MAG TPA: aminoacetone oxidase family FAD-binding enzyme [Spirochaetia bacterium]|nr:aminoacetone oxidase family FAD-binding enzyme [Spirochaetia bacterium]
MAVAAYLESGAYVRHIRKSRRRLVGPVAPRYSLPMVLDTDVCVIGGGPAGMMAAGRAAERGARVLLIEKNPTLGRKLLITGGGRCNVTNAEFRREVLVEKYGDRSQFLHSLFARFGPQQLIGFLRERGLGVVIEAENRAFPDTHRAASVLAVLEGYLSAGRVEVRTKMCVRGLAPGGPGEARIAGIETDEGRIRARSIILATGGLSRPETGSTGDGFRWLASVGHTVNIPEPSLVPVRVAEPWVRRLQGLSFEDVRLTALPPEPPSGDARSTAGPHRGGKKQARVSERGKLLFTHFGLSGPLVLNMSSRMLELSRRTEDGSEQLRLEIDLIPGEDHASLDCTIRDSIAGAPNKKVQNSLAPALPSRLVPLLLELAEVDPDLPANSLTRPARLAIVRLMKAFPLTFDGVLGNDKAITTSGGVSLEEVDFRTMRSRLFENLYLAGDILDFQRRSGGYSLQICWSSGWVAGGAAAEGSTEEEK